MSVKRFVAADMRRALELVRQELGPDAIILSSRRIKEGVEIMTTLQEPPQKTGVRAELDSSMTDSEVPMGSDGAWRQRVEVERTRQNLNIDTGMSPIKVERSQAEKVAGFTQALQRQANRSGRGLASGKTGAELAMEIERARERMVAARKLGAETAPAGAVQSERSSTRAANYPQQVETPHESPQEFPHESPHESPQQQAQLRALQSELADMRLLLEEQLSRMARTPQQGSPMHTGLMRRLIHMGFLDSVAERVVAGISNCETVQAAWSDVQTTLAQMVPASSLDPVMQGGVYAFVGPTGVGKTTTIAKLAARYVLEHGPQNVALVTTDTYRIAAHDQLRSLGRILNVQVKVVDDNQDLPQVLRSLKGCPLVLVDTAGFRQGDAQLKQQLDVLASIADMKTLLVMASNSQLQMLKACVHAHQAAELHGCVLTKLDETASLGEALSVVMEHGLTVYYSTDGQEIPQDVSVARGHRLVATAVGLMQSGMGSTAPIPSTSGS